MNCKLGEKSFSDITIVTSTERIYAHRIILIKSNFFKNLIMFPQVNLDDYEKHLRDENNYLKIIDCKFHFPNFDENIIISYITYLYNNIVDYDNIIKLIEFTNFLCDENFIFDPTKIRSVYSLLSSDNPDCEKIINVTTFKNLVEIFNNSSCGENLDIAKLSKYKLLRNDISLNINPYNIKDENTFFRCMVT